VRQDDIRRWECWGSECSLSREASIPRGMLMGSSGSVGDRLAAMSVSIDGVSGVSDLSGSRPSHNS